MNGGKRPGAGRKIDPAVPRCRCGRHTMARAVRLRLRCRRDSAVRLEGDRSRDSAVRLEGDRSEPEPVLLDAQRQNRSGGS